MWKAVTLMLAGAVGAGLRGPRGVRAGRTHPQNPMQRGPSRWTTGSMPTTPPAPHGRMQATVASHARPDALAPRRGRPTARCRPSDRLEQSRPRSPAPAPHRYERGRAAVGGEADTNARAGRLEITSTTAAHERAIRAMVVPHAGRARPHAGVVGVDRTDRGRRPADCRAKKPDDARHPRAHSRPRLRRTDHRRGAPSFRITGHGERRSARGHAH